MNAAAPVVIAVDGSEAGEQALRFGVLEAARSGRPVRLVHAHQLPVPTFAAPSMINPEWVHDAGVQLVQQAAATVGRLSGGSVYVDAELVDTGQVQGLLQAAYGAAAVVVGMPAPGLRRLLAGTTAAAVAARADCPVFCIPVGWESDREHRRVVLGLGERPHGPEARAAAFRAAEQRGAELVVLHAYGSEANDAVRDRMAQLVVRDFVDHPSVRVALDAREGYRGAFLVAETGRADLVVLGRGESGSLRSALGPTIRTVLRRAVCPVEIVPSRSSARATA
jgi:nucleotide-binding universal stress UspA family protein